MHACLYTPSGNFSVACNTCICSRRFLLYSTMHRVGTFSHVSRGCKRLMHNYATVFWCEDTQLYLFSADVILDRREKKRVFLGRNWITVNYIAPPPANWGNKHHIYRFLHFLSSLLLPLGSAPVRYLLSIFGSFSSHHSFRPMKRVNERPWRRKLRQKGGLFEALRRGQKSIGRKTALSSSIEYDTYTSLFFVSHSLGCMLRTFW